VVLHGNQDNQEEANQDNQEADRIQEAANQDNQDVTVAVNQDIQEADAMVVANPEGHTARIQVGPCQNPAVHASQWKRLAKPQANLHIDQNQARQAVEAAEAQQEVVRLNEVASDPIQEARSSRGPP